MTPGRGGLNLRTDMPDGGDYGPGSGKRGVRHRTPRLTAAWFTATGFRFWNLTLPQAIVGT